MFSTKLGSVFDAKCDLLVLPCNSKGRTTSWVRREILSHQLPSPGTDIGWGKCEFYDLQNGYEKANTVCYAAAVDARDDDSDLIAVSQCIEVISSFSEANECPYVNLPPLGTGAGGLKLEEVITLYKGVLYEKSRNYILFIPKSKVEPRAFVFDETRDGDEVLRRKARVFISYSRTNPDVTEWVRSLAQDLRNNGIDVRVDLLHLRPGMDLPQWMTNEILKADRVLLICDELFAQKSDFRTAGVGWEAMIIQGDLMSIGTTSIKYIPISFTGQSDVIPQYLRSKLYISKQEVEADILNLINALGSQHPIPDA